MNYKLRVKLYISIPTSNILISSYLNYINLILITFEKGFNPKWTIDLPNSLDKIGFNKIYRYSKNNFGIIFKSKDELENFLEYIFST